MKFGERLKCGTGDGLGDHKNNGLPEDGRGLRILVVDDEPNVRSSLALLLSMDHHLITLADCGNSALQKLGSHPFDLVISDYRMPGMNGDELARGIKARHPKMPIVMLTGFAVEPMGPKNPVCAIIHKPCHLGDLREAITQATARQDLAVVTSA